MAPLHPQHGETLAGGITRQSRLDQRSKGWVPSFGVGDRCHPLDRAPAARDGSDANSRQGRREDQRPGCRCAMSLRVPKPPSTRAASLAEELPPSQSAAWRHAL